MLKTQNIRVARVEQLTPPEALRAELPAGDADYAVILRSREIIRSILRGEDSRLLAVVGPCSIHDPVAAIDYARRLAGLARQVEDTLFVVMRVYFEKPRTTIGWKGLINDPHLNGTNDMQLGLRLARRLLLDVARLGLPAGTELLDPIVPQYVTDLLSWAAVGARTTESQTHREMASGLSMPVGFKNSTDGNLAVAVNAIESARHPHTFLGIDPAGTASVIHTTGNPDAHVVLRGGRTPNFDAESLSTCEAMLREAGLPARVMVDCSHAQTGKNYSRQPEVLANVVRQVGDGSSPVMGFMLESNLGAGTQRLTGGRAGLAYGVSITDGCIDWSTTERCMLEAAAVLGARRDAVRDQTA
jgi:3-deoxy-7-phosphoheptulonate synthase